MIAKGVDIVRKEEGVDVLIMRLSDEVIVVRSRCGGQEEPLSHNELLAQRCRLFVSYSCNSRPAHRLGFQL